MFGVSVPALIGMMNGHGVGDIARDVTAFGFLFMPLVCHHFFQKDARRVYGFIAVLSVMGIVFAGRGILASLGLSAGQLDYFSNSPLVLFSFLILFGCSFGFYCLSARSFGVRVCVALVLLCLSVLPVLAMGLSLQRASLGMVVLGALIIMVFALRRAPVRAGSLIGSLSLSLVFLFGPWMSDLWLGVLDKTLIYGANQRSTEMQAVFDAIAGSWAHGAFGLGWGGHFESPAVAGVRVSYTHSFLTSILLKAGLVGVLIVGVYFFGLITVFRRFVFERLRCSQHDFIRLIVCLAVLFPFVIATFFYASYKSLDYGLILLMMVVSGSILRIETRGAAR